MEIIYLVRIPTRKRNHSRGNQHWTVHPWKIRARKDRRPSNGPIAGQYTIRLRRNYRRLYILVNSRRQRRQLSSWDCWCWWRYHASRLRMVKFTCDTKLTLTCFYIVWTLFLTLRERKKLGKKFAIWAYMDLREYRNWPDEVDIQIHLVPLGWMIQCLA